jgi:ABC-type branched-subunit amino acid transport system substrate-binding protein
LKPFRRGKRAWPLTVAAVAALIAGCSSSSHSAQSSTQTTTKSSTQGSAVGATSSGSCSSTSSARGVTGSEITVEGLITFLDFGAGGSAAAKARFDQANTTHELPCGRQIKYLGYADDGGQPDQDLSVVRRFVEQDHVFAIVPTLSIALESSAPYINEQHVPTIGWGVSPNFCTSSNFSDMYIFGFNGCINPATPTYQTYIAGSVTKLFPGGAAGHTAAVIGEDTDTSKAGVVAVASQYEAGGFKVVYTQNPVPAPPAVVSDFTPYVQALMTASGGKPTDAVYLAVSPANAFPLAKALRDAGYKGFIINSTYSPQTVGASATEELVNTFATTESKTPEMAQIVSTLHAGGVTQIGQPELSGYFSADMFIQILKKVGPDLTPERFQQVASNFTYEIPNVVGPTYYPAGFQAGAPCGETVYSNGTSYTISVPYACYGVDLKKQGNSYVQVPYPSGIG